MLTRAINSTSNSLGTSGAQAGWGAPRVETIGAAGVDNINRGTGARLAERTEALAAIAGPGSVAALRGPAYFGGTRDVDHSISIFAGIFVFVFGFGFGFDGSLVVSCEGV